MQCVTTFCSGWHAAKYINTYGSIDNVNYIYRYLDYNITGRGTSFKLYCWGPKITASKETAKCKLHSKNAKWQNMPQILAGIAKYDFFWLFQCVLTFSAFSRYFAEVSMKNILGDFERYCSGIPFLNFCYQWQTSPTSPLRKLRSFTSQWRTTMIIEAQSNIPDL
jgi:hypothetical protein